MWRLSPGERTIRKQISGEQKMASDVAISFLKIVSDREARNRKTMP